MSRATFDHLFTSTGRLFPTKHGKTGGTLVKQGSGTLLQSRLRDIDQVQDAPNNPFVNTLSLLWLPAGTTVGYEYIYVHEDGREFRITKITHAKHGTDTTEKFVKCEIEKWVQE